jgi:hypothetical protein
MTQTNVNAENELIKVTVITYYERSRRFYMKQYKQETVPWTESWKQVKVASQTGERSFFYKEAATRKPYDSKMKNFWRQKKNIPYE